MKPTLALDPALLAIPAITTNEQQVAGAIQILIGVAVKLRSGCGCAFSLLSETSTYLAKAGLYPAPQSISKMLADFDLAHVYTAEDIRRSVNDVLARAGHLETLSSVEFMIPTSMVLAPDVLNLRIGPLREALELTLLHVAFAARSCHRTLIQALIADNLVSQEISLVADVDDIDPPLAPDQTTNVVQFESVVLSAASSEAFLENVPANILWQHAEDDAQLALAIKSAAEEIRKTSGCSAPNNNCERFCIGPNFVASLESCGASGDGPIASLTLETCARVVAKMPKNEVHRFFKAVGQKNKVEDVTRSSDMAEAWRTHIGKAHEAMRLMFWRKTDGLIELANIGPKSEMEIL